MGSVDWIYIASVISLARKKCISQELAGDFTISNLFLDLAYIKKKKKNMWELHYGEVCEFIL